MANFIKNDLLGNIHDRLLVIMENENLSVASFERKVGVGRNSIASAIRNKSSISHYTLQNISTTFPQYSIDWIVFGKESPYNDLIKFALKIKRAVNNYDYLKKGKE